MDDIEKSEEIIYCRWFRHWKTGRRVYPKKGRVIVIRIKKKSKPEVM